MGPTDWQKNMATTHREFEDDAKLQALKGQ